MIKPELFKCDRSSTAKNLYICDYFPLCFITFLSNSTMLFLTIKARTHITYILINLCFGRDLIDGSP